MEDILQSLVKQFRDPDVRVSALGFSFALVVSVLVGVLVSMLYRYFYENRATGSQIHRSFLLISPSVTALFIAIQFSLPLSLGLLGALSIVRFRTPIKEPEEVGFIMLMIACAVVCATFQFYLLVVLLGLVFVALLIKQHLPVLTGSKRQDGTVIVAVPGDLAEGVREGILSLFDRRLQKGKLHALSYSGDLTTLHFSFAGMAPEALAGLRGDLEQLTPVEKINIFFNEQGSLL